MRLASAVIFGAVTLSACRPATQPSIAPVPAAHAADSVSPPAASGAAQAGIPRQGSAEEADLRVDRGDVAQRTVELFGTSPEAQDRDSTAGADTDAGPSWDIQVTPYETHERVEFYVRRYTGPARTWVTERLARGTRYESMIREKLRQGGLPEDLYYLAFVESGFDPNAYSRAAAVGMWQFMASTAKGMGLRVDWWVDERRDPVRSTDAAVRFLRGLNQQFESLYLAAAAYNGGPARVSRGLTRFADELESSEGEDRFFVLSEQDYLPRETREYVPQIIAAALIGKDPTRYGLTFATAEPLAFDTVQVPALTSLPVVARAAGVTTAAIRDLNPHYLRAVTPAGKKSVVRIPLGSRERFDSAFAELPDDERTGVRTVRIAEVTSLANLAKAQRTSADALRNFNPRMKRTKKGNVAAGQTILVPEKEVSAAALTVPDPSIEGRGVTSIRYHVVQSGETLSHIAVRHGTTVATLMRLNHLKKAMIFPGQELVVTGTPAKKKTTTKKSPPRKVPAKKATAARR